MSLKILETDGLMARGDNEVTRVLLLTASFGDGHNQAALAVREALEAKGDKVRLVDYTDWLHPAFRSVAKFGLLQGVQKVPALYGLFYRSMSNIPPSSSLQRQLNHVGSIRLQHCLKIFRPDIVASTFPSPNGVMSELRRIGYTKTPNVAIITDYTVHGLWIQDYSDAYFVATDDMKRDLARDGVGTNRIWVTGIPVRQAFGADRVEELLSRRSELRQAHELQADKPVVLLMGGGAGVLGDISAWEQLIRRTSAQFVVICGRNDRLRRKLFHLVSPRVQILGYTKEVDEWMALSDVIVTKAGGITVTEAIAMELPMLLYRPIPGQEVRNASFAVQEGMAVEAHDVRSACQLLEGLVSRPARLEEMRAAARNHRVENSADRIADVIHSMAEKYASSRTLPEIQEGY